MKTVKPAHGGLPERVKDEKAEELVTSGKYVYCNKEEWKKQVRDADKKPPADAVADEKQAVVDVKAKQTKAERKAQDLAAKKARIAEVTKQLAKDKKPKSP